jgi:hypothetical protein
MIQGMKERTPHQHHNVGILGIVGNSCRWPSQRQLECGTECPFCHERYQDGDWITVMGLGNWRKGKVQGLDSSAAHTLCYTRYWEELVARTTHADSER